MKLQASEKYVHFYALNTWLGLFFCWPIKHNNIMVLEPAFGTFGSVGRCQVLLEN